MSFVWTDELDEVLKSMYNEFYIVEDISKVIGASKDAIYKRGKYLGLSKPPRIKWLTPEIKERLYAWNGDESICSIAREIGVNDETVRNYLEKIGKDTSIHRKLYPSKSYITYKVEGKLKELLYNPTIPAWEISEKYGMSDTWVHKKRKEIFNGNMVLMRNTTGSLSQAESKVKKLLDELDIVYFTNHYINQWSIDFYLGKKMIIEVQGDYWHSLDSKIEVDNKKYDDLISKGYHILYIYEKELNNNINQIKNDIEKFWVSHISDNM